jgi:sigma54-dependent transcription regulator
MTKKKVSLMTWMAIERDPSLFDNVLRVAQELYDVKHVYYLYTSGEKIKTDVLGQNLRFMERKYSPLLESITVEINNPSSLEELCIKLQDVLKPRRGTMGDLIISTTAGTPAMYAAWVLLSAGGFFPKGTELFSAQRDQKKGKDLFKNKSITREDSQKLQKIDFKINTFLSLIRNSENSAPPSEQEFRYEEPRSPKAKEVHEDILRFAQVSGVPLLIYGERGVGKSTAVSNWIRRLKSGITDSNTKCSKKDLVPFVSINCGSLDPNLAEARIFGYVDGAFTNARKGGTDGLIEKARDGILFLDEVQDLKKDVQRKLLQVFRLKSIPPLLIGDIEFILSLNFSRQLSYNLLTTLFWISLIFK